MFILLFIMVVCILIARVSVVYGEIFQCTCKYFHESKAHETKNVIPILYDE